MEYRGLYVYTVDIPSEYSAHLVDTCEKSMVVGKGKEGNERYEGIEEVGVYSLGKEEGVTSHREAFGER